MTASQLIHFAGPSDEALSALRIVNRAVGRCFSQIVGRLAQQRRDDVAELDVVVAGDRKGHLDPAGREEFEIVHSGEPSTPREKISHPGSITP